MSLQVIGAGTDVGRTMDLRELISDVAVRAVSIGGGVAPSGHASSLHGVAVRICDLTEDSRTVLPGSLFIARAGLKSDGRKYIIDAAKAGAAAVIVETPIGSEPHAFVTQLRADVRGDLPADVPILAVDDALKAAAVIAEKFYGVPTSTLGVGAVTGTNGKTTITWLAWQLLNSCGVRCGLIGTVMIDDGITAAPAGMTTPPAIEMSRTASVMLEAGCKAMVIEASSHALHQHRVDALKFDAAVFTNLTGDHLDYHKTMDNYAAAKARLFELLPDDAIAIVNAEDGWAGRMARDCRAPILACATGSDPRYVVGAPRARQSPCTIETLGISLRGMRVRLRGPWGVIESSVRLVGAHNAMNLLQAVALAHALGAGREQISTSLEAVTAPPGRLEPVSADDDDVHVLVDYAHTDDGLRNALNAVRRAMDESRAAATDIGGGALRVVFGCGGDRDRTKRPRMGLAAAELADFAVVTSDNPRSERPGEIVNEILAGVPQNRRGAVSVHVEREQAIRECVLHAASGDVIVIAGKGHEKEQVLSDGKGGLVRVPFDDCDVAKRALELRRSKRV
jgi:UDP-N-acetylmuramoyl-L-alanyl-D-glutamate--2,6-diaminopimelate ligase